MSLLTNIRGIQFLQSLIFLVFSYVPFISTILIMIPGSVRQDALNITIISVGFATIFGVIVIFGIIQARLSLRIPGTCFFSLGILIGFSDVFSLSFGVILSWVFYESWFISSHFYYLDKEYETYSEDTIERIKLNKIFRSQIYSFLIIAWIALSISWGVLLLSSNFFVQIGENKGFGTVGITISISVILLLFISRKYLLPKKR